MNPFHDQWIEHDGHGFNIRKLTEGDWAEYNRVIDTQTGVMALRRGLTLEDFRQSFDRFNKGRNLSVGAFDQDGNLRSCYCMFFWPTMPYVTDSNVITDRSHARVYNPLKSGLIQALRALYSYCESEGYFHHYSVRYDKHLELEMEMWDKYSDEFLLRYERYDELFVPANTRPEWEAYWRVMGEKTYPYDVRIRYTRLMQEHREHVPLRPVLRA